MYNAKDRVWMIFVWAIVANMGLALGPIISVYITVYMGWSVKFLHTLQAITPSWLMIRLGDGYSMLLQSSPVQSLSSSSVSTSPGHPYYWSVKWPKCAKSAA